MGHGHGHGHGDLAGKTVKTVLVTGGAGFIGSNFVHHLLHSADAPAGGSGGPADFESGWDSLEALDVRVVVLDKLTYAGNPDNLASVWQDPRFTFVHGDICDRETVRAVLQDCQWVVNFAAETHVDRSIVDPGAFVRTDVEGTYTLLEVAREVGIERFVQISTDEVYGNAEAPDGTSRPSLETDALKPLSPYAASKAGADRLAFSYWATYGLPVVVTRCSNNYGPYQYPEKQLPLFITNALTRRPLPVYGDGQNTRDWIHVSDHCTALEAILRAPADRVLGEVFNVGAAEERSILENARLVLELVGGGGSQSTGGSTGTGTGTPADLITFVPDRLGHVRRHAVDSSKLRERLGWQPRVSFREGMAQTVAWYQTHGEWLRRVLARTDGFLDQALALAETSATSPSPTEAIGTMGTTEAAGTTGSQ